MMPPRRIVWGGGLRWSESEYAWCGLVATRDDGTLLVRHELRWINTPPEVAALELRVFLITHRIDLRMLVANPEIFPKEKDKGQSISETFALCGVPLEEGSSDYPSMLSRFRSWLHLDAAGNPRLVFHPSCDQLIRVIPMTRQSDINADDAIHSPEIYPVIGLSQYLLARPLPAHIEPPELHPDAVGRMADEIRDACAQEML